MWSAACEQIVMSLSVSFALIHRPLFAWLKLVTEAVVVKRQYNVWFKVVQYYLHVAVFRSVTCLAVIHVCYVGSSCVLVVY